MRTLLVTGTLAGVATSTLIGLGTGIATAQPPDPMQPGTSLEVGKLLECTGSAGRTPIRVNLYQNTTYGNFLEVLVNDGRPGETGASRQAARPFVAGTEVRAGVRVDGRRLTLTGTARPTGRTRSVHDVVEDAGLRIVSTGTHRLLRPDLRVTYGTRAGTLSCDRAFSFRLKVTKTTIVD